MNPSINPPPARAEIAAMEPFPGLDLDAVFVVSDERQAGIALAELMTAEAVGFDT